MMDERSPKYFILKKDIVKKIELEEYCSEDSIPSERELMEQYQVSRITVRKAIDELVMEGYLYRIQGKGTYVKTDEKSHELFAMTSCTEDVIKLGMTPMKKVIVSDIVKADTKRAKALNITTKDDVYRLGRILFADREPLNYTVTYLPVKLFPGLEKHDFACESLYQTLEQVYDARLTKARRTVEAVLAKEEIAEYLEVKEKMPIILFGCTTYAVVNGQEMPVESFQCYYRTDKYKFYIDQVADK